MNAIASLHSSSFKLVSGLNSDCRLTVGPPDLASADVPCPDDNKKHFKSFNTAERMINEVNP